MRTTSRTPSSSSTSRGSKSVRTPTAPSTVCVAPVERCTSKPIEISRSMTCWICSSVDPSCITTTMGVFSDLPRNALLPRVIRTFGVVHGPALDRAGFVQDALEQPPDGRIRQRPAVGLFDAFQDLAFALGLVKRQRGSLLQPPDFQRATRALVQQLDQLAVNLVDLAAPIVNGHGFFRNALRGGSCPFERPS